jgi:hypothetical protein
LQITKFRPVGRGGRRIGVFSAELDSVCLNKLTLIRNAEGEVRVFGDDITRLLDSIAKAALAHAEAQQHDH